ncbi:MAG: metal ABC transporter permease [Deltaproteobacteria bacterium]|nr:metal ABC transporter permease [Deltaproteobacteria bacterium]
MPGFFDHSEIWRNQVLAGVVAGAVCGYLGIWVVLRRVVFVAAALGELAGLGVVTAFLLALSYVAPEPVHRPPSTGTAHVPAGVLPSAFVAPRAETVDSRLSALDPPPPPPPPPSDVVSDDDLAALLDQVGVQGAGTAVGTEAAHPPAAGARETGAPEAGTPPARMTSSAVFGADGVRPYVPPEGAAERDAAAGGGPELSVPVWLEPMAVAVAFVVLGAILLSITPRYRRVTNESVVGLAYLVAAGLVILVGSRIPQGTHEVQHVLYGDSVSLDAGQLYGLLGAAAAVALVHLLFFKEFLFVSYDPETARASGVPTRAMGILLLVSIGVIIASASRAVGALPVFAFLVLPAVAALLCTSSLKGALALSATIGAAASALGYYLAWIWSFPAGAARAVTAAIFVVPALLVRRLRGN